MRLFSGTYAAHRDFLCREWGRLAEAIDRLRAARERMPKKPVQRWAAKARPQEWLECLNERIRVLGNSTDEATERKAMMQARDSTTTS